MRTAVDLLDWSEGYREVAGDGFKAEMVWLAYWSDNGNHSAATQSFELPEWVAFSRKFFPLKYPVTSLVDEVRDTVYEQLQLDAVRALLAGSPPAIDLSGDLNDVTHRVYWARKFGLEKSADSAAEAHLVSLLGGTLTNDEYAKVVLALRCLNHTVQYPRISEILNGVLGPETYHEQLCALVSNFL